MMCPSHAAYGYVARLFQLNLDTQICVSRLFTSTASSEFTHHCIICVFRFVTVTPLCEWPGAASISLLKQLYSDLLRSSFISNMQQVFLIQSHYCLNSQWVKCMWGTAHGSLHSCMYNLNTESFFFFWHETHAEEKVLITTLTSYQHLATEWGQTKITGLLFLITAHINSVCLLLMSIIKGKLSAAVLQPLVRRIVWARFCMYNHSVSVCMKCHHPRVFFISTGETRVSLV